MESVNQAVASEYESEDQEYTVLTGTEESLLGAVLHITRERRERLADRRRSSGGALCCHATESPGAGGNKTEQSAFSAWLADMATVDQVYAPDDTWPKRRQPIGGKSTRMTKGQDGGQSLDNRKSGPAPSKHVAFRKLTPEQSRLKTLLREMRSDIADIQDAGARIAEEIAQQPVVKIRLEQNWVLVHDRAGLVPPWWQILALFFATFAATVWMSMDRTYVYLRRT